METKIQKMGGVNHLCVDGKIIDTLAFKSFRPTLNNVGDFYKAGVRIFHVFCSGLRSGIQMPYSAYGEVWFGPGDYRFENFDRQMEMFLQAAPDAYFFINLHVDTRQWWLEQNPGNANSFTHLSQVAGNEKWLQDTDAFITAFIDYAEKKYGNQIIGYWLLGGHTTEWFSYMDKEESHPVKLAAFRKYMNDPTIDIPTREQLDKPAHQIFLDPLEDETVIAYRKFHAKLVADTVLHFCRTAKEALDYKKLVGVFFGYLMEQDKGGQLWNNGHLDLDRVNESPYVDMIATPSSYRFRQYDDGTAHMILPDSLELHGKAFFSSFDNLTFLAPTVQDNPRRLCNDPETKDALIALQTRFKRQDLLNTREKTIHGMCREMMSRFAKRCGTWWFDMLEGWYYDDKLMGKVAGLVRVSADIMEMPRQSVAEICVFAGTEPLYYVNKHSYINSECICYQRGPLSRIGAPYDLFSMSDLQRVELSRYKLIIFLDAFRVSDEERDYINRKIKSEGRSVLFIGPCDYAGGDARGEKKWPYNPKFEGPYEYVDGEEIRCQRISRLCEMQIGLLEKDETTVRAFNSSYGYAEAKHPTPYIRDDRAEVLGRFADSRECALAVLHNWDYRVFYSAVGNLSHEALRGIAKMAGVHIYAEEGVFTYINDTVAGVYNTGAVTTEITLKQDGTFKEIFSGKTYTTQNRKITLPTGDCPAQMLLLK